MNQMVVDKKRVEFRFEKSLERYDQSAFVQNQISQKLIALFQTHLNETPAINIRTLLEIGSGTGGFTDYLYRLLSTRFELQHFYTNDLVESSFQKVFSKISALCKKSSIVPDDITDDITDGITTHLPDITHPPLHFLKGDCEEITFPTSLDLIASANTFQWITNPSTFIKKLYNSLSPNGTLLFNTFGPTHFQEVKKITDIGLNYLTKGELEDVLLPYFDIRLIREENIQAKFSTPLEILHHMKNTGVTGTSNAPWTKKSLEDFSSKYIQIFSTNGEVPLTYNPIYLLATKK